MMKNKHLSRAVASQKFYEFRIKLKAKSKEMALNFGLQTDGIHHQKSAIVSGTIKKDLKLSDRTFRCHCGYVEDRDFNAALNLRDVKLQDCIKEANVSMYRRLFRELTTVEYTRTCE